MFLLVSVCHVGAHPGEHQHGVSIQISINLGKTFLQISRIRNILLTWILARVFVYVPPFISQILDVYWTVLISILIYFEWCDTENRQLYIVQYVMLLRERWFFFSAAERVVSILNFFRFFFNRLGYDVHSTTKSTFTFPERAPVIY